MEREREVEGTRGWLSKTLSTINRTKILHAAWNGTDRAQDYPHKNMIMCTIYHLHHSPQQQIFPAHSASAGYLTGNETITCAATT